jgi:hypothetical protein
MVRFFGSGVDVGGIGVCEGITVGTSSVGVLDVEGEHPEVNRINRDINIYIFFMFLGIIFPFVFLCSLEEAEYPMLT